MRAYPVFRSVYPSPFAKKSSTTIPADPGIRPQFSNAALGPHPLGNVAPSKAVPGLGSGFRPQTTIAEPKAVLHEQTGKVAKLIGLFQGNGQTSQHSVSHDPSLHPEKPVGVLKTAFLDPAHGSNGHLSAATANAQSPSRMPIDAGFKARLENIYRNEPSRPVPVKHAGPQVKAEPVPTDHGHQKIGSTQSQPDHSASTLTKAVSTPNLAAGEHHDIAKVPPPPPPPPPPLSTIAIRTGGQKDPNTGKWLVSDDVPRGANHVVRGPHAGLSADLAKSQQNLTDELQAKFNALGHKDHYQLRPSALVKAVSTPDLTQNDHHSSAADPALERYHHDQASGHHGPFLS